MNISVSCVVFGAEGLDCLLGDCISYGPLLFLNPHDVDALLTSCYCDQILGFEIERRVGVQGAFHKDGFVGFLSRDGVLTPLDNLRSDLGLGDPDVLLLGAED